MVPQVLIESVFQAPKLSEIINLHLWFKFKG